MGWQTLFDGWANSVPNMPLQSGQTYRLSIATPIVLPDWLAGPVQEKLNSVGIWNLSVWIGGGTIQIEFTP